MNKHLKLIFKILLGVILLPVLVVIIVVLGIIGYFIFILIMGDDYQVIEELFSPKKDYKVVLYAVSGGGAAGYVSHEIGLVKIDNKKHSEKRVLKRSFISDSCGRSNPTMNWADDYELEILFYRSKEKCYGENKTVNNDGKVKIKYEFKEED